MSIPNYSRQVYEIVERIPAGRVTTYGAIANYLALGSARMVGWSLKRSAQWGFNPPAHRVLNANGELSGRKSFDPPELMQALLESEGVLVENNRVQNFSKCFIAPEDFNI